MQEDQHSPGEKQISKIIHRTDVFYKNYSDLQAFFLQPCHLYLNTDAALQFELQADHVHLRGWAQQSQLSHLGTHLIYGHLYGAQVSLMLVHDRYALLHIRETVGGWLKMEKKGIKGT